MLNEVLSRPAITNSSVSVMVANSASVTIRPITQALRTIPVPSYESKHPLHQLITKLNQYLDGLHTLGSGWISGKSEAPEAKSIDLMKALLLALDKEALLKSNWDKNARLLMAPLPAGGVALELNLDKISISVNISNQAEIEIEYEHQGYYDELSDVTSANYTDKLLQLIKQAYSGV